MSLCYSRYSLCCTTQYILSIFRSNDTFPWSRWKSIHSCQELPKKKKKKKKIKEKCGKNALAKRHTKWTGNLCLTWKLGKHSFERTIVHSVHMKLRCYKCTKWNGWDDWCDDDDDDDENTHPFRWIWLSFFIPLSLAVSLSFSLSLCLFLHACVLACASIWEYFIEMRNR